MTAYNIKKLMKYYGENTTLKEVFEEKMRSRKPCIQCEGRGAICIPVVTTILETGEVVETYKMVGCESCQRRGYTELEPENKGFFRMNRDGVVLYDC